MVYILPQVTDNTVKYYSFGPVIDTIELNGIERVWCHVCSKCIAAWSSIVIIRIVPFAEAEGLGCSILGSHIEMSSTNHIQHA